MKYKIIALFILFFSLISVAQNKKFTVILDAGHGGKDPGNSYHGYSEKAIALKTTLKVGQYLENEKDIKIIFTRTTDVFIELVDRPKVANKADANLFISIHCNSVKNYEPYGTETFVMGLSRSNMNLEVAKSENSVILLEDNYKQKYAGFDPNNPETTLGLKMMQEEYLNSSIQLANSIERNFKATLGRKSRGVKQAPLWVLDASYMPSVLIELGFLSNKDEGAFLNSEEGQNKMARQIADAIIGYKKDFYGENISAEVPTKQLIKETTKPVKEIQKSTPEKLPEAEIVRIETDNGKTIDSSSNQTVTTEKAVVSDSNQVVFKVQVMAINRKLDINKRNFRGLSDITLYQDNPSMYKYMYGYATSYDDIKKQLQEAKSAGYETSYIVAFKNGKKIDIKEAIK